MMQIRDYLKRIVRTREEVDRFLGKVLDGNGYSLNKGWVYDPELGWVLRDSVRHDGADNSRTFYHYLESGARRRAHFPEQEARIHTYGNSFTHCDQVNDGETWQEYLAAHLREPLDNYGIGGYSVYQAYRRMLKVEARNPAPYIILNIWSDDHFRNLDSWRHIRFGRKSPCGFTLPHLRVDLDEDTVVECENRCQAEEDVYRLTDLDWAVEAFKDDPVLNLVLAVSEGGLIRRTEDVPTGFGLSSAGTKGDRGLELQKIHARAALRATQYVVEKTEQFAAKNNKTLMILLTHDRNKIKSCLLDEKPWDQEFVDYLKTKTYPVLDARDLHRHDYQKFRCDPDTYLNRFYIGHYAPQGNYFLAMAIKNGVVEWLDPRPAPYRGDIGTHLLCREDRC